MDDNEAPLDICRTCGAEDGKIGIFDERGLEMQLAERINDYLPITVAADDKLPLAMCWPCINQLDCCHQLVVSCLDTEERFKQLKLSNLVYDDHLETAELLENVDDCSTNIILQENTTANGGVNETKVLTNQEDLKPASLLVKDVDDCSSNKIILQKDTTAMEGDNAAKVLTRRVDLKATGLVAPNVYVIPSIRSKSTEEQNSQKALTNLSNYGFFCDGCNVWYKRQDKFIAHQRQCILIKTYRCVICSYTANQKVDFLKHSELHTPFKDKMLNNSLNKKCSVCNRVLSTKMALKLHMRTHSGEKPYNCQYCEKAFAQKNALNYHEKTHIATKPYYCRFCNKGFNGKLVLEIHERIHTGERPYSCVNCGSEFRCLANLRQHQLIHNDDKPFKCPACSKRFRRPEKVRIHLRTHTGEKPYACPICNRGFSQKGDMMKHTLIHERLDELQLDIQENDLAEFDFIV